MDEYEAYSSATCYKVKPDRKKQYQLLKWNGHIYIDWDKFYFLGGPDDSIRYAVNEKPGVLRQGVLWLPEENDAMAASLYIEDYLESIEKKKEEIRRYEHAIETLTGLVVTES